MLYDGRNVKFVDLSKRESYNEIDGILNELTAEKRKRLLDRNYKTMYEKDLEDFKSGGGSEVKASDRTMSFFKPRSGNE